MTISCLVVLGLLLNYVQCASDVSYNQTIISEAPDSARNMTSTTDNDAAMSSKTQTITAHNIRNDNIKIVTHTQPDQIKEDDKNGTETLDSDTEASTMLAESSFRVSDTDDSENVTAAFTTSTTAPFSPSPYLGTVIEEVIEEPIAQHREPNGLANFIPMKSRQSFNSFIEDTPLGRQYPSFHTSITVTPALGDSYSLHSDNSIIEEFENPNFNENPFGRIKFPDEKSKYFPLYLNENEIENQDKPVKFDFDSNYKQYDFPYKIENAGYGSEEVQKEPNVSDKTHFSNNNANEEDSEHTVHGSEIMQNVTGSLPLEMKKSFPTKQRHSAWKKVAHTVMAFLPIGLMLAAIPPRVIKVNSTNYYPAREEVPPAPNAVNRYFKENVNSRRVL